jgi:addiction module HigA family antidote
MNKYVCARPVHPGEILKEEIEYRGISQGKLAAQMGISYKVLNHILNERRPLTPTTAMLIEAALGIPADMLIGMQTDYDMRMVKQDKSFLDRLAEIRKAAATVL